MDIFERAYKDLNALHTQGKFYEMPAAAVRYIEEHLKTCCTVQQYLTLSPIQDIVLARSQDGCSQYQRTHKHGNYDVPITYCDVYFGHSIGEELDLAKVTRLVSYFSNELESTLNRLTMTLGNVNGENGTSYTGTFSLTSVVNAIDSRDIPSFAIYRSHYEFYLQLGFAMQVHPT